MYSPMVGEKLTHSFPTVDVSEVPLYKRSLYNNTGNQFITQGDIQPFDLSLLSHQQMNAYNHKMRTGELSLG